MKVWKMTLILLARFMYLSILYTLKARTKVTAEPILEPPA